MRIFIFLGILLLAISGNILKAQTFSNPKEIFTAKRKIIGGLDNRRTFIKGNQSLIYGLYCGLSFGKNLRLKIGINGNPFPIKFHLPLISLRQHNRMAFISLGEEYCFFRYKRFGLISYIQTGIGYNYYSILDDKENVVHQSREWIVPLELGLHTAYQLRPWLSAKVGNGWRFVFPDHAHDLNGYYLKLGFGIDTEYVWKWYQQKRTITN